MDQPTMRQRVAEARVGRLGTVTAEGRPHLVPCCYVLAGGPDGDIVYFAVDAKPKLSPALRRLANLRATGHASLLVDHYDEDWSTLWWVRLDGRGRILDSGPEREHALDLLAAKYGQYRDRRPPGPAVAIDVTTWRAWP